MESVETILTYMEIIAGAEDGAVLIWGDTQELPEIKYKPSALVDYMRYWRRRFTPDFQDKIIFFMRDMKRIFFQEDPSDAMDDMVTILPKFACGLNHLKRSYSMHKDTHRLFSSFLSVVQDMSTIPREQTDSLDLNW